MMLLSEAAHIVQGTLSGADTRFTAVSTDSRKRPQGALFAAIAGEKFDGHDFVAKAGQQGAAGALVATDVEADLAQIKVADTTQAIGQLASHWRSRFDIPILAVTGSNGKTTVTAMVASILKGCGNCLSPERSFNNQWGVPLTLLRLNSSHDFAVIEMGSNQMGEIAYLSRLTRPLIALINNVAPVHLEGLGNPQQIAQEKAGIFSALNENGTAVINADDRFSEQWHAQVKRGLKNGRVISFAIDNPADLSLSNLHTERLSSHFTLHINTAAIARHIDIHLALPGRHNTMNALAAAAMCYAAGATLASIKAGLEQMQAVTGRLKLQVGLAGCRLIDDSYNANPQSVKAAIDVLANCDGRRILVLGAMAELGKTSQQYHREVGQYAHKKRIDKLMCLLVSGDGGDDETDDSGNNDVRAYAYGFGQGSQVFENRRDLIAALQDNLSADVTVLVKGSRSSMMEQVVAAISDGSEAVVRPQSVNYCGVAKAC